MFLSSQHQGQLLELLTQKEANGTRRYSLQEAQDFIGLLILGARIPLKHVPKPLLPLLAAFAQRIGWPRPTSDGMTLQQALDTYFLRHPPPLSLVQQFQEWTGQVAGLDVGPKFQPRLSIRG